MNKMKKPAELTKEFIIDYKKWNDFAFSTKESKVENTKHKIGKMYDELILKFCSPEKKYQGLAYGSESDHCPKQELVIEELIDSKKAIVKTKFTNEKFSFIEHDFEYHFTLNGDQWILEELYLVDEDGKHKSL
ncbi:NTF2 fold immunity protein [uncultured Maribacter sp.]|uniref:NTF2 fold immunity protein n=1 Tax=uncultured Maribacter sp. TaxID=431308 RepID=UPI0026202E32|nr:NTF2 fold immunity protein [uncultured Maribacter sp.]